MTVVNSLVIRQFTPGDRDAVRQICCDTADCGNSVENFFSDRGIVADLVTEYYTDFEPQSLWVAVVESEVVGYLMGCLDAKYYLKITLWKILPKNLFKAFIRGTFLRQETWRLLRTAFKSMALGGFKRKIPEDLYPAHLHIDIKEAFRNRHIGKELIEKFFQQAGAQGIAGIQVSVRGDNHLGRAFFERMGFSALGEFPMAMPSGKSYKISSTVIYGKALK